MLDEVTKRSGRGSSVSGRRRMGCSRRRVSVLVVVCGVLMEMC